MKVMKKKIIYVLCILAVFLALLGLKKRNDTMYSSGVYHLNRSGIVESIDKIKFDYVKLNFRCFRLPVFRSGRIERLCIRDGISIVFE